jgi:hypothetical protein
MLDRDLFQSGNIPCYVESFSHRKLKIGHEDYKGVKFTVRIEPFTSALAGELGDDVKTIFFKRTDGEPKRALRSATLGIKVKAQQVELRPDPALQPSATLIDCDVDFLRVRESSEGRQLVLRMVITVPVIGANDLLYLKDAVNEQRFFTFERLQGTLFDEAEAEARRESKDAKPAKKGRRSDSEDVDLPVGDEAVATH